MNGNPWTEDQVNLLLKLKGNGWSPKKLAKTLGRTKKAVARKLEQINYRHPVKDAVELANEWAKNNPAKVWIATGLKVGDKGRSVLPGGGLTEPSAPEDDPAKVDYWKKRSTTAERKLKEALVEKAGVDELCTIAKELAPMRYDTSPPLKNWKKGSQGSSQDAVLLLSDTHIGKVVESDQTMGLGNYNLDIFMRRLGRLERSVKSILMDHTTTCVPRIHVCMLGDMLDGALIHSVEAGQHNTLFEQFYTAGHALAQFLNGLSQIAEVHVRTSVGNHTRWGHQRKMPTSNTYSNLDQFLYAYLDSLVNKNVEFHLDKQPFAKFQVCGWNFLATHGTHLRGGDKVLGIPAHSIGRNVMAQSQLAVRSGTDVPNYYCVGHLHRPMELPHTLGDFIVNGGFPGVDGFGLMEAFNSSYPLQKFFLVHPKFGKTAEYKLRLDFGDTEEHNYTLPTQFCCK